jgi:serine/threonine protein kinase
MLERLKVNGEEKLGMNERVGQQVGSYRLLEVLGIGGQAVVYLGEHVFLKRQSAIKLLHEEQGRLTKHEIEQFLKEAQMIARLRHPHIVTVHEYALDEQGMPFLVMDYYPHGTLRQRHRPGERLSLSIVVDYVKQGALALQYAHEQRIIHRDVKPGNMLLGQQGETVLSDFGIATVAHRTSSLQTQDNPGTPPYMAPEQIQRKPTPASDQYALAIVAYQWLAGHRPLDGVSLGLAQIGNPNFPIPLLRAHRRDLPRPMEEVMQQALAPDPQARFPSIQEFADALERASQNPAPPLSDHLTSLSGLPEWLLSDSDIKQLPNWLLSSSEKAQLSSQLPVLEQQQRTQPAARHEAKSGVPNQPSFHLQEWMEKKIKAIRASQKISVVRRTPTHSKARVDLQKRVISLTIMYYGVTTSQKAQNLHYMYHMCKDWVLGDATSIDTEGEPTRYFDLVLPTDLDRRK